MLAFCRPVVFSLCVCSVEVVVPQGKEPPCFLQLFHGGLVIHKSKRDEVPSAGIVQPYFNRSAAISLFLSCDLKELLSSVYHSWVAFILRARGAPRGGVSVRS